MKIKYFFVAYLFLQLNSCVTWNRWTTSQGDNKEYKKAGYGYKNSYYTSFNVNQLDNIIQQDTISIKKRTEIKQATEKLNSSRYIEDIQNSTKVKSYMSHYQKILHSTEPNNKGKTETAAKKRYFDPDLYHRYTPRDNLIKVKMLKARNKIPLTKEYSIEFEKFYEKHDFYPTKDTMYEDDNEDINYNKEIDHLNSPQRYKNLEYANRNLDKVNKDYIDILYNNQQ